METSIPALEIDRLSRLFGTVPALVEIDLELAAGSVCAVVGPNGAGKTTLLRVLSTSLRPSGGTAKVFGHDVLAEPDAVRTLVDLLPAQGGLYPELTVAENLRFAARMRGIALRRESIAEALAWAGLAGASGLPARTISTGMGRRLGLARLRLVRPRLLLLDEPYGGVDEEGRALVDELLAETRASCGSVLVASHALERLREAADEVVELARGCIVAHERAGALVAGPPPF